MVAEIEPAEIFVGILLLLDQVDVARHVEHQRALDLVSDQHLLLKVRRHIHDRYAGHVEPVGLREIWK